VPLIRGSVGKTSAQPPLTFDPGEDVALGDNDRRLSGRQLAYARCQSYASIVASRDERYDRERAQNAVFPSSTVFSTGNSLNASIVYQEQLQRCLKAAGYGGTGGGLFGF